MDPCFPLQPASLLTLRQTLTDYQSLPYILTSVFIRSALNPFYFLPDVFCRMFCRDEKPVNERYRRLTVSGCQPPTLHKLLEFLYTDTLQDQEGTFPLKYTEVI